MFFVPGFRYFHGMNRNKCSEYLWSVSILCGTWWLIVRVEAFRPEGRGFESRCSHRVGTFGKSFTHSCLCRFGVKLRHSFRAVSGAPLNGSGLEEALYKFPE